MVYAWHLVQDAIDCPCLVNKSNCVCLSGAYSQKSLNVIAKALKIVR